MGPLYHPSFHDDNNRIIFRIKIDGALNLELLYKEKAFRVCDSSQNHNFYGVRE